jgi:hypothetical protein
MCFATRLKLCLLYIYRFDHRPHNLTVHAATSRQAPPKVYTVMYDTSFPSVMRTKQGIKMTSTDADPVLIIHEVFRNQCLGSIGGSVPTNNPIRWSTLATPAIMLQD